MRYIKKSLNLAALSLSMIAPVVSNNVVAATTYTSIAAQANLTTSLSPIQIATLLNNIRSGLQQRTLPASEIQLLANIRVIANDINGLYQGTNNDPIAAQTVLKQNFQAHFNAVNKLVTAYYGNSTAKITMATNAFILMSYDAITRYNPDFYWAKLGIFAANEVRSNFALIYTLKNALDIMNAQTPNASALTIAGMSLPVAAQMAGDAATDLLQGQLNVLQDIGSFALLEKQFGAKTMISVAGISPEALAGFKLQAEANTAKALGQVTTFRNIATNAAVQFGIHEQTYLLQPMWDKPNIKAVAKINAWMLQNSLDTLGMRGDIFIGTNKIVPFVGPYVIINAPFGAHDLSNVIDRIAIAKNGFETLNKWRQTSLSDWIDLSQARLGKADGIYQPVGIK